MGLLMKKTISKSQFKARALEFFREVESTGETVIITDHGKPTLQLSRLQADGGEALAQLRGSVLRYDRPADPVGEDDWEVAR